MCFLISLDAANCLCCMCSAVFTGATTWSSQNTRVTTKTSIQILY